MISTHAASTTPWCSTSSAASRKLSIRVPVGERDSDAGRLSDLVAQQVPVRALGILALNLTPQIAELLPNLRRPRGAVVASVSQYGRIRSRAGCSPAT